MDYLRSIGLTLFKYQYQQESQSWPFSTLNKGDNCNKFTCLTPLLESEQVTKWTTMIIKLKEKYTNNNTLWEWYSYFFEKGLL